MKKHYTETKTKDYLIIELNYLTILDDFYY